MFKKHGELNQKLGGLENSKTNYEENILTLQNDRNEIERALNKVNEKLIVNSKRQTILGLVNKTEKVLSKYNNILATTKVESLQKEFTSIFNKMHRKKDLIDRVAIDKDSFEITLYDKTNGTIKKESLSSGELEIYSIAVLWSLAKHSGRNLPFIIDTPLGRLDSDHRDNLVNHYFPNASHQMLIFSTDTEVDKKYYERLKQHISHAYHLEYDNNEGYFWQ